MSRALKFRAWDKKRMWRIEELDFRYQKALEKHALDMVNWVDIEIMQFIGRLDKNGVEIFDGDIFFFDVEGGSSGNCVVCWMDDFAAFGFYPVGEDKDMTTLLPDNIEVIGNKWENPVND